MIEIDHSLLSDEALDNLIIEIITRQTTDYGDYEVDIHHKKKQLRHKLQTGEVKIVYSLEEEACEIMRVEQLEALQKLAAAGTVE